MLKYASLILQHRQHRSCVIFFFGRRRNRALKNNTYKDALLDCDALSIIIL